MQNVAGDEEAEVTRFCGGFELKRWGRRNKRGRVLEVVQIPRGKGGESEGTVLKVRIGFSWIK